mmetsp:Transcript_92660/g.288305  ORF Transcript_92660/g.288305 Transcript_92660/m.288305 type:complete len:195 (-) Transcript_92660:312-896(-)
MAISRALLLLLAVPLSAASAGSEELLDALATDSECMARSWGGHDCALNALQTSARKAGGAKRDEEERSAWPAWCNFFPTSMRPSVCTAATACTCQQYCNMTLPESWQWNPECCSCEAALLQADSQASAELLKAQHHAAGTPQAGSGQPAWCVSIPEGSKPTACTAPGSCTCASFCSDFDSGSWKWNPVCCGCQL